MNPSSSSTPLSSQERRLPRSQKYSLVLLASALVCIPISLLFGSLGALYYVPEISTRMVRWGISLVQLRPLHTTFASAWIFLGAVSCVYAYLFSTFGEPTRKEALRFKAHMILWGSAGLGSLLTLPLGITSGREYLGFHPAFSILIYVGWLIFAWNFMARVSQNFFKQPVYIYMWTVGILYFLWTFAEGHAYLLPGVREHPVADLQIQWKSCGTLVAAFNQMVYGSLIYLGERQTGDKRIAQSSTAFWLFWVGLLNSFTNYAHHTYHLPQAHIIKWIAFSVSMTEIILLFRVITDVSRAMQAWRPLHRTALSLSAQFIGLSKSWNCFLLCLAIVISVPPWNALIHGTHVVMAHAMGSELAIDTYILLGVTAYLLRQIFPKREVRDDIIESPTVRNSVRLLNLSLIGLVAVLLIGGLVTGIQRYLDRPVPGWMAGFPLAFLALGVSVAWLMMRILFTWLPLFLRPSAHQAWVSRSPSPPPHPNSQPASRNPVLRKRTVLGPTK